MNDAIFFSLSAVAFYALEIFITDWKLSHISPRFLTLCYALGVAIFAFIGVLSLKPGQVITPNGKDWVFIILMIIASFGGAISHFFALNRSTGTIALTIYYMLLPVAGSIYVYIFRGNIPSIRIVIAWLLAGIAVILITTAKMPVIRP